MLDSFARSVYRLCKQLKADLKRFVYPFEHLSVQMADTVFQPAFVDRAQLFQQYYGIATDLISPGLDRYMRWQLRLVHLLSNGCADHGRTVKVPHIILNDQHRTDTALLRTDHRP